MASILSAIIGFVTLSYEITLIRVVDSLFYKTQSLYVLGAALLFFGLSGFYYQVQKAKEFNSIPLILSLLLTPFIVVVLNLIPTTVLDNFFVQIIFFLFISFNFFTYGYVLIYLLANKVTSSKVTYAFNLGGSAVGCLITPLIIKLWGPEPLLLFISLSSLFVFFYFHDKYSNLRIKLFSIFYIILLFSNSSHKFEDKFNKRDLINMKKSHDVDFTQWHPISKIEVLSNQELRLKRIIYDGGIQRSEIYDFDGDLKEHRRKIFTEDLNMFWEPGVLLSHFSKENSSQNVLIIGGPGGQELRAALAFGASKVDVVEMISTTLHLSKNIYSDFNGNIFNRPEVHTHIGDGRSFLRRQASSSYDIIQIYSNFTSSTFSSGHHWLSANYLYTKEAFQDYFSKLKPNGIVQINSFLLPRIIRAAAKAWSHSQTTSFDQNVLVISFGDLNSNTNLHLPSLLVKNSAWSLEEIEKIKAQFAHLNGFQVVKSPFHNNPQLFPNELFNEFLSPEFDAEIPYIVSTTHDNSPFFYYFWKTPTNDNSIATTAVIRDSLKYNRWYDLIVPGTALLFLVLISFSVFLYFSSSPSSLAASSLQRPTYIICFLLGSGYYMLQSTLISQLSLYLGGPQNSFPLVLLTMLFGGALGSYFCSLFIRVSFLVPIIITAPMVLLLFISQTLYFDQLTLIILCSALLFTSSLGIGTLFPVCLEKIKPLGKRSVGIAFGLLGLGSVFSIGLTTFTWLYSGFLESVILAIALYLIAYCLYYFKIKAAR